MTERHTETTTRGGARSEASAAAEEVRQGARDVAREVKERASDLRREGERGARSFLDAQREAAAAHVRGIADALDHSARELEDQGRRSASSQVSRTARQMERFSRTLEQRDVDDLLSGCGDFARREPLALFGMSAVAGFLFSRFLKASAERPHDHREHLGDEYGEPGSVQDFEEEDEELVPHHSGAARRFEAGRENPYGSLRPETPGHRPNPR